MKYYDIMFKKILGFALMIVCAVSALAQTGENSPYSRFGIGDVTDNNFMYSRQMGGMGASYADPYYINIVNPASYAYLKATAFDVGIYARRTTLNDGSAEATQWGGNLEYLSLAFPLTNPINEVIEGKRKDYYVGMAFTLMTNSRVSYNVFSDEVSPDFGDYTLNFAGSGGSYKFLWGNAINYKDVAFGLNIGYLFGNIQYERNTFFNEVQGSYFNNFITDYRLSGFIWNAGLMYNGVLNKKELEKNNGAKVKRLSVGLNANTSNGFNTDANVNLISVFSGGSLVDTTLSVNAVGKGQLPAELGIGAFYHHAERVGVGFNLATANWSSYFNDAESIADATPTQLSNSYKANIGGYWRPSNKSYAGLLKKFYYRYGLFYNTDPRSVDGDQVTSYGATFGIGMPFVYQRKISHANLGATFGRRGTGTAIEESYFQINFSFTYNDDEWFLKRRYN